MNDLEFLVQRGAMAADWAQVLQPLADRISAVEAVVKADRTAGAEVLPEADLVWEAFRRPMSEVRVLVLGQDPYPTPGHAVGLAFSAAIDVTPLPRSVANIYRELHADLDVVPVKHPDLTEWADQGVLLLNRVLTVRAGEAGSHRGIGWEEITEFVVHALVQRGGPLVVVLWGNDARALAAVCKGVPVIESAHPSPLSASRGFFGSRPFSRVNESLRQQGAVEIDWQLSEAENSGLLW